MNSGDPPNSYVTAKLPNNAELLVEVTPVRGGGDREHDVASIERVMSLASIGNAIHGISGVVLDALHTVQPDTASIEFGIEVGVNSGQLTAILVKGSAKANLKITLQWTKDQSKTVNDNAK